jgi:adenosylcobyric acid synthase
MGNPHLIILPGTKSTVNDLDYLRQSGMANAILKKAKEGVPVVGICGGYQMLGQKILDPQKVESERTEVAGLGLLDMTTDFMPEKSTVQVRARVVADRGLLAGTKGMEVTGYEIHMGQSKNEEETGALNILETPQGKVDYADGMLNDDGTVMGTYMHGLFYNDDFRHAFLNSLRQYWGLNEAGTNQVMAKDEHYDRLAELVRSSLDIAEIYRIVEAGI